MKEKTELTIEERKARRAAKRDRAVCRLAASVMVILWALIALFLLVIPRSKVSQIEKRELTKFPKFTISSYFSGEFTEGIMTWYTDTVPFRDTFKNANNNLKNLLGLRSGGEGSVEIVGNVAKVENSTESTQTAEKADGSAAAENAEAAETPENGAVTPAAEGTPTPTPAPGYNGPDEEEEASDRDFTEEFADGTFENGFVIAFQDGHWRGMPLFAGTHATQYVTFLNDIKDILGDSVNVYAMPVPLASAYYLPSNFSEYSQDQGKFFKSVFEELDDDVIPVDIFDVLDAHKEEDIYLRTDHHWQPLGAYYAARELAKAADVPFADLKKDYDEEYVDGYVGSLYGYTQSANLLNDPERFTWYVPHVKTAADYFDTYFNYAYSGNLLIETDVNNSYLRFMGRDDIVAKISTAAHTGRKLLILKDSYGNAEVPFLTGSFDEIWVTDLRYFDRNLVTLIKMAGITDFVFTCESGYVGYNGTATPFNRLLTQSPTAVLVDDAPDHSEELR